MKGHIKLLSVFLSLAVMFSLAVSVKAEDVITTKITYTIEGEEITINDGRKGYANEVKVIFKVESSEEIKKIESLEDTGRWIELPINDENEYIAQTSKAGEYTFQLRVYDENDKIIATSDEVNVLVDRVEISKDDDTSKDPIESHEHEWDFDGVQVKEPTLNEDGYIRIPCIDKECNQYLELKISLYTVEKEKYIFDLNKQEDMVFNINSKGFLATVTIDDLELEEDEDYTYSENNQIVTIKKSVLSQLDNGIYEISFIYLDMDMDALDDIDDVDIDKLLQRIKMGIAFTELEVIGTKPKPDVVVEEKTEKDPTVIKQKEEKKAKKSVKTSDDSPIILYTGLVVMMGSLIIVLRHKKSV